MLHARTPAPAPALASTCTDSPEESFIAQGLQNIGCLHSSIRREMPRWPYVVLRNLTQRGY